MRVLDIMPGKSPSERGRAVRPAESSVRPLDGAEAAALVSAIATDKDRQAFARLFAFYGPRLKAFLARRASPTAIATTSSRTPCSRCGARRTGSMRRAGRSRPGSSRSRAISEIDRRRRLNRRAAEDELYPVEDVDPSPSAEGVMLSRETEIRVRTALASCRRNRRR